MSKIVKLWVKDYEAGATYLQIANKYGVSESTIFKHIKRNGVGRTRKQAAHTGATHHMWRGNDADVSSIHRWVKKQLTKPKHCTKCTTAEPADLTNISPIYNPETYTRDLENWSWMCRSCHMQSDGRIHNLRHQ